MGDTGSEKVFEFFKAISEIPRGSGNTAAISAYCRDFAARRGLECFSDEVGNVVILKNGSRGYENSPTVMLQAHLDMVCEKRADCKKDMSREPITVVRDGDFLHADGTTLGADNGIGVAYILALLDDKNAVHPPLEAVLTVDEETGFVGAAALDLSRLTAKRMINLDADGEGKLTVSCAGAARITASIPMERERAHGLKARRIDIKGLIGGHSGIDIGAGRKNAARLMGQLLYLTDAPIKAAGISSGGKMNAIPREATAVVCFEKGVDFDGAFERAKRALCERICRGKHIEISANEIKTPEYCFGESDTRRALAFASLMPNGVLAMSDSVPFLVETSSNIGILELKEGGLEAGMMARSNARYGLFETLTRIRCLADMLGGKISVSGEYEAWEYKKDSPLRKKMVEVYRRMYGKEPEICAIHAGLECGIFANGIEGADIVAIGPDMYDIHTPDERLDIKSAVRCFEYLTEVLKGLKD